MFKGVLVILGKSHISKINQSHADVLRALTDAVGIAIGCGLLLVQAKDALRHGEFEPWVEHNCKFSLRTAQKYMRLFDIRDEIDGAQGIEDALRLVSEDIEEKECDPKAPRAALLESATSEESTTNENGTGEKDAKFAHLNTAKSKEKQGSEKSRDDVKSASPPPAPPEDEEGHALPTNQAIRDAFDARQTFTEFGSAASKLKAAAQYLKSLPAGGRINIQQVEADIGNARRLIVAARPHALCPYCAGDDQKCRACKGDGWVPKQSWDTAPADLRAKMKRGAK